MQKPTVLTVPSAARRAGLPFFVRLLFALAGVILVGRTQAQSVALRDLPRAAVEIEDPFSMVNGAVEVAGGRVIALDGLEAQLFVVDFARGVRTALGRRGSGPGEYRIPAGIIRIRGDTVWAVDAGQMRIVVFNPDLTAGTAFPFLLFDQKTSNALSGPYFGDSRGRVYANAMTLQGARTGGGAAMQLPDSVTLVRVDARDKSVRSELARVRLPVSGKPEMQVAGSNVKYKMAFPGLVAADVWGVFPDGRVGIVRGATYSVEFISPEGKRSSPAIIPYEHIRVTDEDKKAEMAEAQRQLAEQQKAMRKFVPANVSVSFDLTAPEKWPNEYPPVTGGVAIAAPDGNLWVKRAIPVRRAREQWDVIDRAGKLVARWQLPPKVALVGVGAGVVYTSRTDEDDLRYLQRVPLPRP